MDNYVVYTITNKLSKRVYVGVTNNPAGRVSKHKKASSHVGSAIRRYGWENFEFKIVISNLSKDEAYDIESILVDSVLLDTSRLYNHRQGGVGGFSAESRGDRTGAIPWNKGKRYTNINSQVAKALNRPSVYCLETDTTYSCCAEFCRQIGKGHSQNVMRAVKKNKKYYGYTLELRNKHG